jgi:hypothetical protein
MPISPSSDHDSYSHLRSRAEINKLVRKAMP